MAKTEVTDGLTSSLFVATTVHFGSDILERVSGLTFLYDPNWSPSQNQFNGSSLPFAFFETLKHDITQANEVSESRVILYDPESESMTNGDGSFKPSVLQVVADNITTKPIMHKIDCLVPYGFITKRFDEAINIMETAVTAFSCSMSQSSKTSKSANTTLEYIRQAMAVMQVANSAVASIGNVVSAFSSYNNAMYNRNSILAMQRNRNLIQFKTWEGWELKYGVIKNFFCTKVGSEDDYLRATIEIEELPILFIGDTTKIAKNMKKSGVLVKKVQGMFQSFYKSTALARLGG